MKNGIARTKFVYFESVGYLAVLAAALGIWSIRLGVSAIVMTIGIAVALLIISDRLPGFLDAVPTANQERQVFLMIGLVPVSLVALTFIIRLKAESAFLWLVGAVFIFMALQYDWAQRFRPSLNDEGAWREVLALSLGVVSLLFTTLVSRLIFHVGDGAMSRLWDRRTPRRCALCMQEKWVLDFAITTNGEECSQPFTVDGVCRICRHQEKLSLPPEETPGLALLNLLAIEVAIVSLLGTIVILVLVFRVTELQLEVMGAWALLVVFSPLVPPAFILMFAWHKSAVALRIVDNAFVAFVRFGFACLDRVRCRLGWRKNV